MQKAYLPGLSLSNQVLPHKVLSLLQNWIEPKFQYSLGWGIFMLFHTNFTLMIHTVAIWLTLSLAIWRFIMINSNLSNNCWYIDDNCYFKAHPIKLIEKLLICWEICNSRFIMIKFPSKAVALCTVPRCKMVLAFGYGKLILDTVNQFWISLMNFGYRIWTFE